MSVVQHCLGLGLGELKAIDHQKALILFREGDLVLVDLANGTIPLRKVLSPGLVPLAPQVVGDP